MARLIMETECSAEVGFFVGSDSVKKPRDGSFRGSAHGSWLLLEEAARGNCACC